MSYQLKETCSSDLLNIPGRIYNSKVPESNSSFAFTERSSEKWEMLENLAH